MSHHSDGIKEDTRVVIWLKAGDFGVLCPDIGVENKYLVNSDGRTAAKMVLIGDQVVVLPPPRQPANSRGAESRTTTNSRARARQQNHSRGGAAQGGRREPQSSRTGRPAGFSGTGTGGSRRAAVDRRTAANSQSGTQQQGRQLRGSATMKRRVVAARNPVLTAEEKRQKSGGDAVAKGQEGSQTAATHARQQHQSQDTHQQHQSQKISEAEAAAAEDAAVEVAAAATQKTAPQDIEIFQEYFRNISAQAGAGKEITAGMGAPAAQKEDTAAAKGGTAAQNAAAENLQLQVQQLRAQLHHEKKISQGLLDACQQPEVAAAAKQKQNTAAEETEVPEWAGKCAQLGVKVQMGNKQHEDSNTVYSRTDSRITGYGFTGVGVHRDVHARQQAELASSRKSKKLYKHRPPCKRCFAKLQMPQKLEQMSETASKWCAEQEAEAAAKQLRKTEAAASARVSKVEQAAAPATDIFGLIAAAAEADEVARKEAAQAEAATDIKSVIRGIQFEFCKAHQTCGVNYGASCSRWIEADEWGELRYYPYSRVLVEREGTADYQRTWRSAVGGDLTRCAYSDDIDATEDAAMTAEHILISCSTCSVRFDSCILTLYSDMCTHFHKNMQCGECVHHCNKWNFGTEKERAAICRAVKRYIQ